MISNLYDLKYTIVENNSITQEIETKQIGTTKQDHAAHGSYKTDTGTTFWTAIFDGHGSDLAIDLIRNADLNEIMKTNRPYDLLHRLINDDSEPIRERLRTGSTMIYVKATVDSSPHIKIEIVNIGDSNAVLYLNGEPIFINELHTYKNGEEILRLITEKRLDPRNPIVYRTYGFESFHPDKLITKPAAYIRFYDSVTNMPYELTPSQSLGHNDICGLAPTITHFRFRPKDTIRIVLFSDGVGDVLPIRSLCSGVNLSFMANAKDTSEILEAAHKQWQKSWISYGETNFCEFILNSFEDDGYDDCSCAIMDISVQPDQFTIEEVVVDT